MNPLTALVRSYSRQLTLRVVQTQRKKQKTAVPTMFRLAETVQGDVEDWQAFVDGARPIAVPKSKLRENLNFVVVKDEKMTESVTVYDVLPEAESSDDPIMCNFLPMVREYLKMEEKEEDYVYDIYIGHTSETSTETQGRWANLMWKDEQVYYSGSDTTSELSTEDSNAEDYYGNDYPDDSESEYSQHVQSSESESDW